MTAFEDSIYVGWSVNVYVPLNAPFPTVCGVGSYSGTGKLSIAGTAHGECWC